MNILASYAPAEKTSDLKMMKNDLKTKRGDYYKNIIMTTMCVFFAVIFLWIAQVLVVTDNWIHEHFGKIGFDSILFTITNPLEGKASAILARLYICKLVSATGIAIFFGIILVVLSKKKGRLFRIIQTILMVLTVPYLIWAIYSVNLQYKFIEYYFDNTQTSTFIDDNYAFVKIEDVVFPENKRNLILILLESAENTFNDTSIFNEPLMPHLAQLKKERLDFDRQYQMSGTGWSIGGITAYLFGLPLRLPAGMYGNSMSLHKNFLPGAVSLLDVLEANGYRIVMTKGAIAAHAGTDKLFYNHAKTTEIYDWRYFKTTQADAKNHPLEWRWGLPDIYVYEKTKTYLAKLDTSKPFFLMFITVDTHTTADHDAHVYTAERKYGDRRDAFIAADDMVYDFLSWLQKQNFYDNTTVIIMGDHLLMSQDMGPVKLPPPKADQRDIYNVIINPVVKPDYPEELTHKRAFASFDMAPTILESIGAKLPERRFGMGSSLFSSQPTLLEKYGVEKYQAEINKRSKLYDSFH